MRPGEKPLSGKRILTVEDEFVVAFYIVSTLEDFGAIAVGPVGTVGDALKHGQSEKLDGVVLDLTLGYETSLPVARLLKQRGIPFILMTGHSDDEIPDELGTVPRLPKPFKEEALLEVCRAVFV